MDNFDYKKYSLENLEKWMSDALLSSEATPKEIYDVIRGVVHEEYHCFKYQTGRCYELLALLNDNGEEYLSTSVKYDEHMKAHVPYVCDKDDKSPECQNAWNDFWEENNYPEEHSQYTEEELDAMCNKAASDDEKEKCREYNLREAEYYDKRIKLDSEYTQAKIQANSPYNDGWTREHYQKIVDEIESKGGYDWTPLNNDNKDKVVKWQLPVEVDGLTGDCYVSFPDDLLEAANLKEGDTVEWIDRKNGSFELRKVTKFKLIGMEEC